MTIRKVCGALLFLLGITIAVAVTATKAVDVILSDLLFVFFFTWSLAGLLALGCHLFESGQKR